MADEMKTTEPVKPEAKAPIESVHVAPKAAPVDQLATVKEALALLLTHFAKRDATQQEQGHAVALLEKLQ